MIWNTITHPKMMFGGPTPSDDMPELVVEGIKYADPHKLAFFDLLVDKSDRDNPKLIHGDFETVKNKILNHELVIGGEISYDASLDGKISGVVTLIGDDISYEEDENRIVLELSGGSILYFVASDNTVSPGGEPHVAPNV